MVFYANTWLIINIFLKCSENVKCTLFYIFKFEKNWNFFQN